MFIGYDFVYKNQENTYFIQRGALSRYFGSHYALARMRTVTSGMSTNKMTPKLFKPNNK